MLIVVGKDRANEHIIAKIVKDYPFIRVIVDSSRSFLGSAKLLFNKRVRLKFVIDKAIANLSRERLIDWSKYDEVKNDFDLKQVIDKYDEDLIILFRASLIIKSDNLYKDLELLNIHCAKIPDYKGLGSIHRALIAKDFEQFATLHRVVRKIDSGEIIDIEIYKLDSNLSFAQNEDKAIEAGYRLLCKYIKNRMDK